MKTTFATNGLILTSVIVFFFLIGPAAAQYQWLLDDQERKNAVNRAAKTHKGLKNHERRIHGYTDEFKNNTEQDVLAGADKVREEAYGNVAEGAAENTGKRLDSLSKKSSMQSLKKSLPKDMPVRTKNKIVTATKKYLRHGAKAVPKVVKYATGPVAVVVGTVASADKRGDPYGDSYPLANDEIKRKMDHEKNVRNRFNEKFGQQSGYSAKDALMQTGNDPTLRAAPNDVEDMKMFSNVDKARAWALDNAYAGVPVVYEDENSGEVGLVEIVTTDFSLDGNCRTFRNVWRGSVAQQQLSSDVRTACQYGDEAWAGEGEWTIDGETIELPEASASPDIEKELESLLTDVNRTSSEDWDAVKRDAQALADQMLRDAQAARRDFARDADTISSQASAQMHKAFVKAIVSAAYKMAQDRARRIAELRARQASQRRQSTAPNSRRSNSYRDRSRSCRWICTKSGIDFEVGGVRCMGGYTQCR